MSYKWEKVWSDEEITCPYCGHTHIDDIWNNIGPSLEGSFDFECEDCEREFHVVADRVVTFTSTPTAEEE